MSPGEWTRSIKVVARVRRRLEGGDPCVERDQFDRLSAAEMDLLIQREREGW